VKASNGRRDAWECPCQESPEPHFRSKIPPEQLAGDVEREMEFLDLSGRPHALNSVERVLWRFHHSGNGSDAERISLT